MTIPADIEATLNEHVNWIQSVIADAERRGAKAIQEAIAGLTDEQLPGMLFCLLSAYAGDAARAREAMRDHIAREQLDSLDNGGPVL